MQSRLPSISSAYLPSADDLKRVPSLQEQYALIIAKVLDPEEAVAEQLFITAGLNYAASANATEVYGGLHGNFLTFSESTCIRIRADLSTPFLQIRALTRTLIRAISQTR